MLYEFHNSPVKETKNDRGFASYRSGLHFTEKEIESAVFQNTEGKTLLSVTHVTKNTSKVTITINRKRK